MLGLGIRSTQSQSSGGTLGRMRSPACRLVELITESDARQATDGKLEIPSRSEALQASWQRPIVHGQVEIAANSEAS